MQWKIPSVSSLRAKLTELTADRGGNTALLFAISIVPLLGIVGYAVDYSSAMRTKTLLQTALDTAVLAGAQSQALSTGDPQTVVNNYIMAAFAPKSDLTPTVSVDTSVPGVVTAHVTLDVPNTFMKIIGTPTSRLLADSQATYGSGKLEVALVLDTTYSMIEVSGGTTKLYAAQQAAKTLVNTLFSSANASNIKVGLVPFTYYVNVGTSYAGSNWLTNTSTQYNTWINNNTTWTCATPNVYATTLTPATCTAVNDGVSSTYDCSYYALLSAATGCTATYTPQTITDTYNWNGCVGSRGGALDLVDTVAITDPIPALVREPTYNWAYGCPQPLQRLTANSSSLLTQIDALTPNQETYIAPGLLWGWRVLSPNAPFADGDAYGSTKKAIVLMTDGFNTHSTRASSPDHEGADVDPTGLNLTNDPLEANTITKQTCLAIRAKNITIYAIAFQVTDPVIKGILQACATDVSYYFDATTVTAMNAAFATIGQSLTQLRLTR